MGDRFQWVSPLIDFSCDICTMCCVFSLVLSVTFFLNICLAHKPLRVFRVSCTHLLVRHFFFPVKICTRWVFNSCSCWCYLLTQFPATRRIYFLLGSSGTTSNCRLTIALSALCTYKICSKISLRGTVTWFWFPLNFKISGSYFTLRLRVLRVY